MATTIIEPENEAPKTTSGGRRTKIAEGPNPENDNANDGRILAGFLYSFSKTTLGEYFPLFVGVNPIGSGDAAQIRLLEEGVSELHATINITKKKNENALDFRIQDKGSTNSTFIDDNQLFTGDVSLIEERSVIAIGGYDVKVVKIDYIAENLSVNPNFKSSSNQNENQSNESYSFEIPNRKTKV